MKFNPSAYLHVPAQRYGEHPCLVDGHYESTYAQTNDRANRLAWALIERGLGRGVCVAVLQKNGHEAIECLIAMWKSGTVMVPLNARNSMQENIAILQDVGAQALIYGCEFDDQIEAIQKSVPQVRMFIRHGVGINDSVEDYETLIAQANSDEPDVEVDEQDLYRIHYSSGTTGKPRGIVHSYRNRKEINANMFINADRLISDQDVMAHVAPLTHAAGYLFMPYYVKGAKHIILKLFDEKTLLQTIQQEKVTCVLLVPTMIVRLLEYPQLSQYDVSSLKRIFYGTAPMPVVQLKKAVAVFGNIFRQNYGLSEAVQPLAYLGPNQHIIDGTDEQAKRLGSAGQSSIGPEMRIVDDDNHDVPTGQIGEVIIRGPHISRAYFNAGQEICNTDEQGWFHTGDLAYRDEDGYLFIVDRKKDMIITGSFNVYSREVELVLDHHPSVLESAVVGIPDHKWGQSIKAYLVLRNGCSTPTQDEIVTFCIQEGLAKYKIPRHMQVVNHLPKNEYGKVLKKQLKDTESKTEAQTS